MKGYKPEELFDSSGRLVPELRALAPEGERRMSANKVTNGGTVRKPLRLPEFEDYAVNVEPGVTETSSLANIGKYLRDVIKYNQTNFRLFGPGESIRSRSGIVLTLF
jgi:xylulose-5-phosphate/fructose-6-phosphate phosphoketolase